jgi:O-antigen ligase
MSVAPMLSLFGEPKQLEGLFTSLGLLGIYLAARGEARDAAGRSSLLTAWLVAIGLASLYALVQAAGLDPIQWVGGAVAGTGGTFQRPGGGLGHPNLLGVMAAAAAVASATWAALEPRRRRLHCAIAIVCGLALVLTLSRAAWLGGLAGAGLAGVLAWRARSGAVLSRRALTVALVSVLAVAAAVLLSPARGPVVQRFDQLFSAGGSGASRLEIWHSALTAWRERPVVGHGPDTFLLVFPRFQTPAYWRLEWGLLPLHAHSIYLHALATRGVLGLLAMLALAGAIVATMARAWSAGAANRPLVSGLAGALLAVAVAGLFGAIGIYGALFVAVACAVLATAAGAIEFASVPVGRIASVVGAAVMIVTVLWATCELVASRSGAWAAAVMANNWPGGAVAAERASRLDPHDDLYPLTHARALLSVDPQDPAFAAAQPVAEAAARRAIALAPLRATPYETLAWVLTSRSLGADSAMIDRADSNFTHAIELAPGDGMMLNRCARIAAVVGRVSRGRMLIERAVALYPNEGALQSTLAAFMAEAGDTLGACRVLERALAGAWHDDSAGQALAARALATLRGRPPAR